MLATQDLYIKHPVERLRHTAIARIAKAPHNVRLLKLVLVSVSLEAQKLYVCVRAVP